MKKNKNQNLLKVYEVKELLGIPLSTVYYLTKIGAIKSIRLGKHIRYKKEDINYYLENGFKEVSILPKEEIERRLYTRIKCRIDCRFAIKLEDVEGVYSNGVIRDISACGLFLSIAGHANGLYKIKNDYPIDILFRLDMPYEEKGLEEIRILGRIVRADNNGIGVRYRNIPEDIKNKIIRYVG